MKVSRVGFISALIYTGLSIVLAGAFFVATLLGNYNWLTRLGGAGWVFLLSMIILMPVVTPLIKKRVQSR
ncbi:MAG: hypothetical protein C4555_07345 [Dehalococcoidia bacterium]|nr:MAG: hypothetical protein C4555_07345 [Dehalococcoidia bacterium]